jgi:alkanesulfonate monooxygenase SsuD/methylene tetrahydromethanopterin reductase-like flavin-dependent oxidoreductase (luciferase family)
MGNQTARHGALSLPTTSDHLALTPDVQGRYPAPFYEPFTTLGWLAGVTRRIEIGSTVVILPYRQPVEVARMAANIDQLSGGRLLFGVGVGWSPQEFAALGVPFHRRGALTNEYLAALKTLWTNDVASFEGRYVAFRRCTRRRDRCALLIRRSGSAEPVTRPCAGPSAMVMPGTRTAFDPVG